MFVGIDVLLSVRIIPQSGHGYLCHSHRCQAALGVSASYDALINLIQCIAIFLERLHIYTEITLLPSALSGILVTIMVEILSVFGLATKQIKQGRFSK
jgi:hypothetical protein